MAIACRRRHFSPRTEESYRYWIRQYIFFHDKRHPDILGEAEVVAFLNHLAVNRKVAASTQSQALNALVFLYSNVLEKPLPEMIGIKRVQHRYRVPVVLTQDEVRAVLGQMKGTPKLMAQLLYHVRALPRLSDALGFQSSPRGHEPNRNRAGLPEAQSLRKRPRSRKT